MAALGGKKGLAELGRLDVDHNLKTRLQKSTAGVFIEDRAQKQVEFEVAGFEVKIGELHLTTTACVVSQIAQAEREMYHKISD